MSWQELIFNPKDDWISKFDLMARKRFNNDALADDAVTSILNELALSNYLKLGDFSVSKSPAAYLTTVFRNRLEDKARQRYGRPRPPAWISKLGGSWITVFKRLCLERQDSSSILFSLANEHSKNSIQSIITTIKIRHPKCGKQDCQEVSLQEYQEKNPNYEVEQVSNEDCDEEVLLALAIHCQTPEMQALKLLTSSNELANIQLNDEQQLILKLIYQQGMKVSQIARKLHYPDHKIRKIHKETLLLLKNCITVRQDKI